MKALSSTFRRFAYIFFLVPFVAAADVGGVLSAELAETACAEGEAAPQEAQQEPRIVYRRSHLGLESASPAIWTPVRVTHVPVAWLACDFIARPPRLPGPFQAGVPPPAALT